MSTVPRTGPKIHTWNVQGFYGGINLNADTANMSDEELIEAMDVDITPRGAITPRPGIQVWERLIGTSAHIGTADKNYKCHTIYPYLIPDDSGGTPQYYVVMNKDGYQYIFKEGVSTALTSTTSPCLDGIARYMQWGDVVVGVTDNRSFGGLNLYSWSPEVATNEYSFTGGIASGAFSFSGVTDLITNDDTVYLSGASSATTRTDDLSSHPPYDSIGTTTDLFSKGGSFDEGTVSYRFTIDIQIGPEVMCETGPLYMPGYDKPYYWTIKYADVQEGNSLTINFKEDWITELLALHSNSAVRRLNIYRSSRNATYDSVTTDVDFYWVGAVDLNVPGQSGISRTFTDYGGSTLGKRINYSYLQDVPPARFMEHHAGRLWYGCIPTWYPLDGSQSTGSYQRASHRSLYYSSFLPDLGPMPMNVRSDSQVHVGQKGQVLTGIKGWKDQILISFFHNSTWGIIGGVQDIVPGTDDVPDVRVEELNPRVGCVAPGTITTIENHIFFLSQYGPTVWDGTTFKTLKGDHIRKAIQQIDATRLYNSVAAYDSGRRKIYLCVADTYYSPGYNGTWFVYDFEVNAWSRYRTSCGVAAFAPLDKGVKPRMIFLSSQRTAAIALNGQIGEVGVGNFDFQSANTWSFQTSYIDCGQPNALKQFRTLHLKMDSPNDLTIAWDCDNGKVTGSTALSVSSDVGLWDDGDVWQDNTPQSDPVPTWEGNVLTGTVDVQLPDSVIGYTISITISGDTIAPGSQIVESMQMKYVILERDRRG